MQGISDLNALRLSRERPAATYGGYRHAGRARADDRRRPRGAWSPGRESGGRRSPSSPFRASSSSSSRAASICSSPTRRRRSCCSATIGHRPHLRPRWRWPWLTRTKISTRVHNVTSERLKVNDLRGNPIEIATNVVWRVTDTAQALFDVDDYNKFVFVQIESAVRAIAAKYPYDDIEHQETTLRGHADVVSHELKEELQERVGVAGITIDECRLTHLAYAPEIAQSMLRRQQAEAVIAARQKIVIGAVSMVESALQLLSEKNVVELDDERRAAMVSNLMVVLCSERDTQPIVNTGTLYQ